MGKKKKSGRTHPREWGEWSIGEYPNKEKPDYLSEEQWQEALRWRTETTCYVNEIFQVNIKDVTDNANNVWKWLSIKRRDKKAIHDWRALQRIKNELVGEEFEAIEIYPSESQLVDEANQYHLWVMPEGQVAPVGFRYGRTTCTPQEAALVGGRQRAFTD